MFQREETTHTGSLLSLWEATNTCAEVSLCQGLQDGVHGSHVEDEAKLGHTHGDEA